jgi:ATP adenylyltransferase/5',5'''-P-1,P-4-tetraphosphate phosphorylase II
MEKESLEQRALRQFDALVARGNLLWRTTTPQLIKAEPFNVSPSLSTILQAPTSELHSCPPLFNQIRLINPQFQFRSANSLTAKPIQKINDPGRTKDNNVFSDSDPDFFLSHIGPSHTLILNKYSVVRPQYLLHTNVFVPQADHLTEIDLAAAWNVLSRLDGKYLVIYNCGFEGGSSVGHKHLQILPRPGREEFEFFPNVLGISEGQVTTAV